jgi:hypothetical protein
VRVCGYPILVVIVLLLPCTLAMAVDAPAALPADSLVMTAGKVLLWDDGKTSVVELAGPVHIELAHTKMSAENAVVWITSGKSDAQRVEIVLLGKAELKQQGILRLDHKLYVGPAEITGAIRLIGARITQRDDKSAMFTEAAELRDRQAATTQFATTKATTTQHTPTQHSTTQHSTTQPTTTQPATSRSVAIQDATPPFTPAPSATQPAGILPGGVVPIPGLSQPNSPGPVTAQAPQRFPTVQPAATPAKPGAIAARPGPPPALKRIEFDVADSQRAVTSDGYIADVCTGGVTLRYVDEKGNLTEFVAQNMVLFTNLKAIKGAGEGDDSKNFMQDHIVSAYFEGDVEVYVTPVSATKNELRMRAEHVYYEFATDRALMTDVVFHTVDIQKNIPIFMRADKIRQMSVGEFKVDGVEMTSSAFATPTYGLYAGHAYVRAEDTGDPRLGEQMTYKADNVILNAFGLPIFYLPVASGTMTSRGGAFRNIAIENDNQFGDGARTEWGLFETLGILPPKDVDASYQLDYFSKRGPGGGLDGKYDGGFIDESTKQPWNFIGDFESYFVDDHGTDILGAARNNETPTDHFRGRAYLENQNFLSNDVEVQVHLGYVSDSTFMAQWFQDDYYNKPTVDDSIYLKRQHDSEAATLLVDAQPNRAISMADEEQENKEISRLPEIGYYSVGDSVLLDRLTFFGEDTGSALKFVRNTESLAQQGFFPGVEPGLPAYGYTGDPGQTIFRGDLREEVDYPINTGPVKVVPYAFARYTGYSQGVVPKGPPPLLNSIPTTTDVGSNENRFMVGAGVRATTDFWRVDDTVQSDLFDLHRIRHVVEPELNLFTSAQSVDQNRLFIYDPMVDAVNDVSAVEVGLLQRWQTKRGGPGRWRSVDFFTLNLTANLFTNQPAKQFRDPTDFRGYFESSEPEASVPRNSINANAEWRVSDSTAVLASAVQNMDSKKLALASFGIAIQRDTRLSYFIGTSYIADLDSNVATVSVNYTLDRKYSVNATESLDLDQTRNVFYTFSLIRSFDNFSASVQVYYDEASNSKGISFSVQPFGLSRGLGSNQVAPQD